MNFNPTWFALGLCTLLGACSGGGSSVGSGAPGTDSPSLNFDEIRSAPLLGSIGSGSGTVRDQGRVIDPYSIATLFESGAGNAQDLDAALGTDGLPVGDAAAIVGRRFTVPESWPPASASDASALPLPANIVEADYAGAFAPGGMPWTANWTLGLDGRIDSFGFFGAGMAPGSALGSSAQPISNRRCPPGSTRPGEPVESFITRFGVLDADELQRFIGFGGSYDLCRLPPRIIGTVTLTNDKVYLLSNDGLGTVVGNGDVRTGNVRRASTLRIQPGTLILGEAGQSLIVTRGARLEAIGAEAAPITFSSVAQIAARFDADPATDPAGAPGEWGGIVLMGSARHSACGASDPCDVEAGDLGFHAGSNDGDSSGSLAYVVIRNTGSARADAPAQPALQLLSTGRQTSLDRVQIHQAAQDAIVVRGGNSFLVRTLVTDHGRTALDWNRGWTGGLQFFMSLPTGRTRGSALYGRAGGTAPISFPLLAHLTLLGPAAENVDGAGQALVLDQGTRALLSHSILTGTHANGCLDLDGDDSFQRGFEAGGAPPTQTGPHLSAVDSRIDCLPFNFNENG